ncbi:MAG: hypothetical protein WAW90_02270, partial [Minisyncoccia bacterium]
MIFYRPEPLEGHDIHPFFYFCYKPGSKVTGLFKDNLPLNYFEHEAEYTTSIGTARAIVLPNNFLSLTDSVRSYIAHWADEAERLHIPLFLFSFGDFTDSLSFDSRVYVFKLSLYRSSCTSREIIVPTLTEDLGDHGITLRQKAQT